MIKIIIICSFTIGVSITSFAQVIDSSGIIRDSSEDIGEIAREYYRNLRKVSDTVLMIRQTHGKCLDNIDNVASNYLYIYLVHGRMYLKEFYLMTGKNIRGTAFTKTIEVKDTSKESIQKTILRIPKMVNYSANPGRFNHKSKRNGKCPRDWWLSELYINDGDPSTFEMQKRSIINPIRPLTKRGEKYTRMDMIKERKLIKKLFRLVEEQNKYYDSIPPFGKKLIVEAK